MIVIRTSSPTSTTFSPRTIYSPSVTSPYCSPTNILSTVCSSTRLANWSTDRSTPMSFLPSRSTTSSFSAHTYTHTHTHFHSVIFSLSPTTTTHTLSLSFSDMVRQSESYYQAPPVETRWTQLPSHHCFHPLATMMTPSPFPFAFSLSCWILSKSFSLCCWILSNSSLSVAGF